MSFTSHNQDQACGSSNITLNGHHLPQEWDGDIASGSGSYLGAIEPHHDEWFLQHDLDLEWNSACLHGTEASAESAQVLTVNILAVDGKPTKVPAGFTISFKQQTSPPALLRLAQIPDNAASHKDVAETWRNPPLSLRLVVANSTDNNSKVQSPSLETDIEELKALQTELKELQAVIAEKKKLINSQLRKEVQSFTEELNQCNNITCIFRTITEKAQGAWNIAIVRFQSSHQKHMKTMGRPEEVFAHSSGQSMQISGGRVKIESSAPRPYEASTVS